MLRPYLAIDIVANKAKNPTATPEGIVVKLPSLLLATMSGPKTDVNSTASQIVLIASDAHMSRASSHADLRIEEGRS